MPRSDYPAKYSDLIDAEVWAFIDRSDSFYPPDTAERSIEQQREVYNLLCASFHAGYPDGVSASDGSVEGEGHQIPTRSYVMAASDAPQTVVYYHGGGYVAGGLESHDDVCAEICARTGCPVVSVDYRLSPEFNYPKDFSDALCAFRELAASRGGPVVLCGDSAGANLCAAVSHATKHDAVRPVGQVLIYGAFGSDLDHGTYVTHADAPMITTSDTKFYKSMRTGGNNALFEEPTCAPLNAEEFAGLPPTVLISAQCDPLSGDSALYHQALLHAGVPSHHVDEAGLVHGFLRARNMSSRARDSFTRIVDAVGALGRSEWPY